MFSIRSDLDQRYSFIKYVTIRFWCLFLCPHCEMAKGHIEFILSMCVCVHFLVWPITLSCMVGVENTLEKMIVMTRQCVINKKYVARSKVTVHTYSQTSIIQSVRDRQIFFELSIVRIFEIGTFRKCSVVFVWY